MAAATSAEVTNESLYRSCVQPIIDAAADSELQFERPLDASTGRGGVVWEACAVLYTVRGL